MARRRRGTGNKATGAYGVPLAMPPVVGLLIVAMLPFAALWLIFLVLLETCEDSDQ